ncbi:hypothetical protein ACFLUL_03680 [Chloroflexota bacterium]
MWLLIDKVMSGWLRIKPLRIDKVCIIGTRMRRYRGQPVQIDDSTSVSPGDLILELHMNGAWFLRHRKRLDSAAVEKRWNVSIAFAEDLRYLACQLMEDKFNPGVRALYVKTLLYSPVRRLGFTVSEVPNSLHRYMTTFYLSKLRRIYYFGKYDRRLLNRKPLTLVDAWMSIPNLLER